MSGRGAETYSRLLEVAMRMFGERGFEGVSTREIAGAAGTTLPSIAYHFGSKQGLYEAVFSTIAEEFNEQLAPVLSEVEKIVAAPRLTRAQCVHSLQKVAGAHARVMLSGHAAWTALIVREQLHPTGLLPAPHNLFDKRMMEVQTALLGKLSGLPPKSEPVKLQALMLTGRVLTFRVLRRSSLRLLGWKELKLAEVEKIVAALEGEIAARFRTTRRSDNQSISS